eukprot:763926_1
MFWRIFCGMWKCFEVDFGEHLRGRRREGFISYVGGANWYEFGMILGLFLAISLRVRIGKAHVRTTHIRAKVNGNIWQVLGQLGFSGPIHCCLEEELGETLVSRCMNYGEYFGIF